MQNKNYRFFFSDLKNDKKNLKVAFKPVIWGFGGFEDLCDFSKQYWRYPADFDDFWRFFIVEYSVAVGV